eukprot:7385143-Prymnesium_polylepis.2
MTDPVPYRTTSIDVKNEWHGAIRVMWTVDQLKERDGEVFFATKIFQDHMASCSGMVVAGRENHEENHEDRHVPARTTGGDVGHEVAQPPLGAGRG